MIAVNFSDLRNHARRYFDEVEKGETIEVYRHGKPVAILAPIRPGRLDRWKRARPLNLGGVSLSKAILAEREQEP